MSTCAFSVQITITAEHLILMLSISYQWAAIWRVPAPSLPPSNHVQIGREHYPPISNAEDADPNKTANAFEVPSFKASLAPVDH